MLAHVTFGDVHILPPRTWWEKKRGREVSRESMHAGGMRSRQGQAAANLPGETNAQVRLAEFAEKHTGQGEYSALPMELAEVMNLFGHWIWAIPSTANGNGSAKKLASVCPVMKTVC
jgi:hypothetical protein